MFNLESSYFLHFLKIIMVREGEFKNPLDKDTNFQELEIFLRL